MEGKPMRTKSLLKQSDTLAAGAILLVYGIICMNLYKAFVGNYSYFQDELSACRDYSCLVSAAPEYPLISKMLYGTWFLFAQSGFAYYYIAVNLIFCVVQVAIIAWVLNDRSDKDVARTIFTFSMLTFCTFLFNVGYFDNATITLCMGALALLKKEKFGFGIVLAFAVFFKIWPGMLLVFLPFSKKKWRELVAFVVTSVALGALTVVLSSWNNLLAPLTYQKERGIEQGSLWALPFNGRNALAHEKVFEVSQFKSIDVVKGVSWEAALQNASTLTLLASMIFCLYLVTRLYLKRKTLDKLTLLEIFTLSSLFIALFIGSNKVFSPDYSVWLIPMTFMVGVLRGDSRGKWYLRMTFLFTVLVFTTNSLSSPHIFDAVAPAEIDPNDMVSSFGFGNMLAKASALLALTYMLVRDSLKITNQSAEYS